MMGRGWPASTCSVSAQATLHSNNKPNGPTNFAIAFVGYDFTVRAFLLVLVCAAASGEELTTDAAHEIRHVPPPPCPVRGPRFAAVTIDVYFAFGHNPSGIGAELARRAVENARAKDVRELLRLAPAGPVSNSPGAQLAAEALVEAELQGRPFAFLDRVLHERAGLALPELVRAGLDAGLDADRLATALSEHRHTPEVERRLKEASDGGHSAGELMVNGRRTSVWVNEDVLATTINEARRRAQALIESGVPVGRVYDALSLPDETRSSDPHAKKRTFPDLAGAPMRGPATAPITVVVFSSLACGSCGDMAAMVRRLRDAWPGRVREVWRSYVPAFTSAGNLDVAAAEIAAAAAAQDRFWALHDLLFAPGRPPLPRRSRAELEAAARTAGVDLTHRDPAAEHRALERDAAEARRLSVPFAPAVLVNGILFHGVPPQERLDRLIRSELQRGIVDRLSNTP
jgi:protein-disulfide isomerase